MEYRTLGRSGCAVSSARARHDDVRQRDRRGRRRTRSSTVRRGRRHADRHRRRLHRGARRRSSAAGWPSSRPTIASQVVLATKGRFPMGDGPNDVGLSRRHLRDALDASLRAARRRPRRPLPGARLRPADAAGGDAAASSTTPCAPGKIRYVGLSNFTGWQIQKVVDLAEPPRARAAGHAAAAVQPARRARSSGRSCPRASRPGSGCCRGRRSAAAG